jgi:hypothetical protein
VTPPLADAILVVDDDADRRQSWPSISHSRASPSIRQRMAQRLSRWLTPSVRT